MKECCVSSNIKSSGDPDERPSEAPSERPSETPYAPPSESPPVERPDVPIKNPAGS